MHRPLLEYNMWDLLEAIISYLSTNGALENLSYYKDAMPETPHKLVAIYEIKGVGPVRGGAGAGRAFQIVARSSSDDPEWAKTIAWSIYEMLSFPDQIFDLRELEEPIDFWGVMAPRQTPFKISVDKNNRTLYGFNVAIVTQVD